MTRLRLLLAALGALFAVGAFALPAQATTGGGAATPDTTATTEAPPAPLFAGEPNCLAYWYYGTKISLCDRFPDDQPKPNCKQVEYQVELRNRVNDPWGLDGSGGGSDGVPGVGCQRNKIRKFPHPHPSSSRPTSHPTASSSSHPSTPAATGTPGPTLPLTGSDTPLLLAAGGVGVLAFGTLALLLTRRARFKA